MAVKHKFCDATSPSGMTRRPSLPRHKRPTEQVLFSFTCPPRKSTDLSSSLSRKSTWLCRECCSAWSRKIWGRSKSWHSQHCWYRGRRALWCWPERRSVQLTARACELSVSCADEAMARSQRRTAASQSEASRHQPQRRVRASSVCSSAPGKTRLIITCTCSIYSAVFNA